MLSVLCRNDQEKYKRKNFPLLLPIVQHFRKTKPRIPLCTAKILTEDDFDEVYTAVYPARRKWREIGLKLKLHVSDLDDIEHEFRFNIRRLQEVVRIWLAKHPGWEALVSALKAKEVGEEGLAPNIEMKYVSQLQGLTHPQGPRGKLYCLHLHHQMRKYCRLVSQVYLHIYFRPVHPRI